MKKCALIVLAGVALMASLWATTEIVTMKKPAENLGALLAMVQTPEVPVPRELLAEDSPTTFTQPYRNNTYYGYFCAIARDEPVRVLLPEGWAMNFHDRTWTLLFTGINLGPGYHEAISARAKADWDGDGKCNLFDILYHVDYLMNETEY